jgi:hypothetical protein
MEVPEMNTSEMLAWGFLPLKLFLVGVAWMGVFGAMLLLPGQRTEGDLLTRLIFSIGLLPPPICFGTGLGIALWRGVRTNVLGAWVNGGALLLHGLVMVVVLEKVLG